MHLLSKLVHIEPGASPAGGQGGIAFFLPPPPPPPPRFISCPPTVFFGRKKLLFLAGKTVKSCDFGQKKLSDFGEELFFFFFFLEITCFWLEKTYKFVISAKKKPSDYGKDLFFFFWRSPDCNFALIQFRTNENLGQVQHWFSALPP